jgi:DNA-binding protein HU-beta
LIDAIAKDGGLSRADATRAVNPLTTTVAETLKKGEEVAITGWQVLCVQAGGAYGTQSADRRAGQDQSVKDPRFAAGATLKTAVAGRRK